MPRAKLGGVSRIGGMPRDAIMGGMPREYDKCRALSIVESKMFEKNETVG
jgi:hypothetical protein